MEIAGIIQTGMLAVVIVQLWVSHTAKLADHERRKKQATFEFINAVSERYKGALRDFNQKHGFKKIVDLSDYDETDKYTVRSYLSEVERISAGVNAGVFDYDMLRKMMATSLKDNHYRFNQYIRDAQGRTETLYCEFDEVVKRLNSDAAPTYNNLGKMRHS